MKKQRWWKSNQPEAALKSTEEIQPSKPRSIKDLPVLYTARQVAEYFGVNHYTVYKWNAEGLIKGDRLGRHLRFTAEQIAQCKARKEALSHG